MALTATLQFGDNTSQRYTHQYLVADVHSLCQRHYNHVRPDKAARCESVEMTLISPDKFDLTLYEWYCSGESRSGRIVFELPDVKADVATLRTLLFTDARCFRLGEEFNAQSQHRKLLHLAFKAEEIKMGDITLKNS